MLSQDLIKQYKESLEKRDEVKNRLEVLLAEFEQANQDLYTQKSEIEKSITCLENEIEESALTEYYKTKNKKLVGGIGIQERKTITYDEEKAFNWAKEHSLCLSLDVKAFEKLAESQKFDFVKLDKVEKVTFPKEIKL